MLLERYYDETLAQASYLVGCEATREAVIVDPNRDADAYMRAAAARRMKIRVVTETHIHADYLSGARELARKTNATLALSDHGGEGWRYGYAASDGARLLRDGDTIDVGRVRLHVMHTPGHTPEHIAFLVTDRAVGEKPIGMLSGDFVFVGDVGRPDLLEKAAKIQGSMESAARTLFASIQRTASLPDYLQILPGHGAGSACGKSLGAMPQTTLGYERLYNPAFQRKNEADFVRWVLADQPEPPNYFAEMKRLNKEGPPDKPQAAEAPQLDAAGVEDAFAKRFWIIDVRGSAEFARGHIPGTINIPASNSLATYCGTVLSYDRPIVIIAKTHEQARKVIAQLALIGMDRIAGWATLDVLQQVRSAGRPVASMHVIDTRALAAQLERGDAPQILDVRGTSEWKHGHIEESTHVYLGNLMERADSMPHDQPVVVLCQGGTRSSIGASLLMARGFTDVSHLSGGIDGWRKAGLPLTPSVE